MKYLLRPYQKEAVEKLLWSIKLEGNSLAVLPTGAGKSVIIADLVHRLKQSVLIVQPSKEILEQNYEKLTSYVSKNEIGVYSASMNRKDINTYTFATIQSIYKKPELFKDFKTVIIDECHLVNPKRLSSMFTTFLTAIGNPKVAGFSATPYRLDQRYERLESGSILTHTCTKLINRIKGRFWHRIVFNINIEDLIKENYLVPLKYIDKTIVQHKDIPTNISKSDFNLEVYEDIIKGKKDDILEAVYFGMELSKSVLVFCSSVKQAEDLSELTENSAVVTSKTKKKDRTRIIKEFRTGAIQTVFNVGVLTIGFDHPKLGCIVLLRPTKSIGLFYQMLGRGVRTAKEKRFCYVIDMTGTVNFIGKIETIKLVKKDMWELESEKGSWHNRPLYSFLIEQK